MIEIFLRVEKWAKPCFKKRFLNVFRKPLGKPLLLGEKIYDSGLLETDSFVKQFMQHLECLYLNSDISNVKDITGTLQTIEEMDENRTPPRYFMRCTAGAGDDANGIVVGTGTTTPTTTDYAMESLISHGTGSGELEYQAYGYTDPYEVGGNIDAEMRRSLHNDSGGTVTINEVGWQVKTEAVAGIKDFLIFRELHTLAIDDAETGQIQILVRTTV